MKIIEIENLSKAYGDVKAVRNLSFSVNEGELFAFLGLNGAGKSTTISIICGQLAKDSGSVRINGEELSGNIDKIKRELGVVFQSSVLDKSLTVKDNLESRAALYGITGKEFKDRLAELAVMFEFGGLLKRPVGKLSGGQKRRIDVARALLHKPKILILDEPTTGLDPQTRKTVWSVIDNLRKTENITVFLTTHYMEETTDADHVVILNHGEIAAQGTVQELKNKYTGDFITLYNVTEEQVRMLGKPYEKIPSAYRIAVENSVQATEMIVENPQLFTDYEITKGKMDDVFLAVTGLKLVGGENDA
ncbi:MAG: ABC transporter ATP-binding protein [Faecalibacterium sp.]|nr:ABC transporter ATP-binding protein [Ruminococcus sp.]MCM1391369.1 ABC transporter ATP-binding protein [Ruminococcus sp.]MCM1484579.1 ABC transporter ATP-binding protein [Faecalibacterium sp.]